MLQEELQKFALRMAAEFPNRKEQLIFLINNYDMMLAVLKVSCFREIQCTICLNTVNLRKLNPGIIFDGKHFFIGLYIAGEGLIYGRHLMIVIIFIAPVNYTKININIQCITHNKTSWLTYYNTVM